MLPIALQLLFYVYKIAIARLAVERLKAYHVISLLDASPIIRLNVGYATVSRC